jgi:hypothetical protein
MILRILFLSAASVQPTFTAPPAPGSVGTPATEAFLRSRDSFANSLREACISQEGVAIIIEDWARHQRADAAALASGPTPQQEIAEAAFSNPIDMARLERALRRDSDDQAMRARERAERGIEVLRRLPAQDRAIYARRFTIMQPTQPPRMCWNQPGR